MLKLFVMQNNPSLLGEVTPNYFQRLFCQGCVQGKSLNPLLSTLYKCLGPPPFFFLLREATLHFVPY